MTTELPPPVPRGVWPKAVPLLVLAGLLAYANSFTKAFVFDDFVWITNNPDIGADPLRYAAVFGRPVAGLTLALNYRLGGLSPVGYHAVNVAVHVLAGLALYGLVRRTLLLPRFAGRYDDSAPFLAFAVALLWLVHPLQTQAVTYVVQRCESMMGLFYLFAIYAWVRGAGGSRAWYVAAVVSFWLSLGSKEVAATLPPVLLIFDRVFLARSWRELVRARWAAYLPVLAVWAVFLRPLLQSTASDGAAGDVYGVGFGLEGTTPFRYLLTQAGVILHYLRLSVWPVGQAADYLDWPIAKSFAEVWPAFLAVSGLFLAGCVLLAARPAAGFVVIWFFLILAPTSSVMPIVDPAFEHRMYLPLAAVVVAVVFAAHALVRAAGASPVPGGAALAAAALPLLGLTIARNETYRTHLAMWEAAASARPNNPRAWANIASLRLSAGDLEGGVEAIRRAGACTTPDAGARAVRQLPLWLVQVGRLEEAEAAYRVRIAAPYNPFDHPIPYRMLARILIARGEPGEAGGLMRTLVGHQPLGAENYLILAAAELAAGRVPEARVAAAEAARLDPNLPRATAASARPLVFNESDSPEVARLRPLFLWEAAAACLADGDRDPMMLDTLALWHARLARPGSGGGWLAWPVRLTHLVAATDAARRGVAAAEARGDADWAAALRARLKSYEAGRPLAGGR